MRVFQCVTTCSLVTFQWNFKGISRLYRHSFILKVKAAGPSETSENFSQNTRRHITKYWKLLSHCLGNFRFHVVGCGCCLFVCFFLWYSPFYGMKCPRFEYLGGARKFIFIKTSRQVLCPTQPSVQWIRGDITQGKEAGK